MEEYPSPAEGIGLENRQAGQTAQGFESPFLLIFLFQGELFSPNIEKAKESYFLLSSKKAEESYFLLTSKKLWSGSSVG